MSTSSTWSAWRYCGSRPSVRGNRSLVSRRQIRAGSAAARRSSATWAPAWSDRLIQPSASGGDAIDATTRALTCSSMLMKPRKSDGTNCTSTPALSRKRSAGPKKPDRYDTPGFVNTPNRSGSSAPLIWKSSKSSRLSSACRNSPGTPGPSGTDSVSIGVMIPAASDGESLRTSVSPSVQPTVGSCVQYETRVVQGTMDQSPQVRRCPSPGCSGRSRTPGSSVART